MLDKSQHFFILMFSVFFLLFGLRPLALFLPASPFIVADSPEQKVCAEFGCLSVAGDNGNKLIFHPDTFAIGATISGFENLYTLKEEVNKLEGVISFESAPQYTAKIVPDYAGFINENEMNRKVNISIEAPMGGFKGKGAYDLIIMYDGHALGQMRLNITDSGYPYSVMLPKGVMFLFPYINLIAFIIFVILTVLTYLVEIRYCKENTLKTVSTLMLARYIALSAFCLIGFSHINSGVAHFLILCGLFLVVMPWGILRRVRALALQMAIYIEKHHLETINATTKDSEQKKSVKKGKLTMSSRSEKSDNKNDTPPPKIDWQKMLQDSSQLWIVLPIIVFLTFIYAIFSNSSFLWAMYEERDFLRSLAVGNFSYFPTLGPELLQGGQTPGGLLYIVLAPFAKIGGSPAAFALLNKILFILSAIVIWVILNKYASRISATFGLLLFCSSSVISNFVYWPIHPSMSVALYFVFVFLVLKGLVDGSKVSILLSGLLLSVLVQFHFSYYLLLIAYMAAFVSVKNITAIKSRTFFWSLLLFIIPLAPYVIVEILHGFPNLRLIIETPRFHHTYVESWSKFGTIPFIATNWMTSFTNFEDIHYVVEAWRVLLFLMALCIIASAVINNEYRTQRDRLYMKVLIVIFGFPMLLLFLSGMGFNYRHNISFAPAMFLLTGTGIGLLIRYNEKLFAPLSVIIFGLMVLVWLPVSKLTFSVAQQQSEWAIDYNYREKLSNIMSSEFGISSQYESSKIYWWWPGWSVDPAIYEYERNKNIKKRNDFLPMLQLDKPENYIIYKNLNNLPRNLNLFQHIFDLTKLADIDGLPAIWMARLKQFKGAYPTGNSNSHVQLEPVEQAMEFLNLKEEGIYGVDYKAGPNVKVNKSYLLLLQRGRIRVLIDFNETNLADKTVIQWEMVSASLNGYYQEIKTIWKPYLTLRDPSTGEEHLAWLLDDVVGSLIYKTPLRGTIEVPGTERNWEMSIGVKGWFDQSSMTEPILQDAQWKLSDASKHSLIELGM